MASTRVVRARATRDARAAATTATKAARALDAAPSRVAAPRRARAVSFDAELERTIGVADARVDRGDVWELPRTCDGCGLYILPGRARWSCVVCELRGDAFDLCAGCRDGARARAADDDEDGKTPETGARKRKRTGKGEKETFAGHGHGLAAFELVEGDDDEG